MAGATVTIIVSSSEGGSVTTPGEGIFYYYTAPPITIDLFATVSDSYQFVNWTGTGAQFILEGERTNHSVSFDIPVEGNFTFIANFECIAVAQKIKSVDVDARIDGVVAEKTRLKGTVENKARFKATINSTNRLSGVINVEPRQKGDMEVDPL